MWNDVQNYNPKAQQDTEVALGDLFSCRKFFFFFAINSFSYIQLLSAVWTQEVWYCICTTQNRQCNTCPPWWSFLFIISFQLSCFFSSFRIISVNNASLHNFPMVMLLILVSCLLALAGTSRLMLNISSYNEHLCLITDFSRNASNIFTLKYYAIY